MEKVDLEKKKTHENGVDLQEQDNKQDGIINHGQQKQLGGVRTMPFILGNTLSLSL